MDREMLREIALITEKAFQEVSIELLETEFLPGKRFIIDFPFKVAIIIGITGSATGRLYLECDLETAVKVALIMNFGERLDEPNDVYTYLAEFGNMISGRATTYMTDKFKNKEFRLSPPAIFSGKGLETLSPRIKSKMLYFRGKLGKFFVDIGFEEEHQ